MAHPRPLIPFLRDVDLGLGLGLGAVASASWPQEQQYWQAKHVHYETQICNAWSVKLVCISLQVGRYTDTDTDTAVF
jgi:hypothetical protein